jgi:hypothetical protein
VGVDHRLEDLHQATTRRWAHLATTWLVDYAPIVFRSRPPGSSAFAREWVETSLAQRVALIELALDADRATGHREPSRRLYRRTCDGDLGGPRNPLFV